MNREIKFRVWSIPLKSMFYDDVGIFRKNQTEEILMQFTGLKDKNGKAIYEGDIVSCYTWFDGTQDKPDKKSIIKVELYLKTNITESMHGGYDGYEHFEDIEVIGNIFDTPDLIAINSK